VNQLWSTIWRAPLTRRGVAKQFAGVLLAAVTVRVVTSRELGCAAAGSSGQAPALAPNPTPVVSFFLDQPYLDMSGSGMPYRPPQGMRAGQPLAALNELEFRNLRPYA
jgi:hypothetical protein